MDCLFCKIIDGQIPATRLFENEYTVAFADINPQAPTHILVIPKTHVAGISETTDDTVFAQTLATLREIARQRYLSDYRVVINNGAEAGQTVFHLHMHLLAGRPFAWPPG